MKSYRYWRSVATQLLAATGLIASCRYVSAQQQQADHGPWSKPGSIAEHSYFFVAGTYVGDPGAQVMHGQMFVEKLTPAEPRHRFPIVLIHGAAQTATNWMGTPDGREGWAEFLTSRGYVVYMVDQPARGRSAWLEGIDGQLNRPFPAETAEKLFTAPEQYNLWPQAKLHTQWPGDGPTRGRIGDPIFDQFYASQVPFLTSTTEGERLMQRAGAALLERIGPAILLTHSQSGPFGWLIADARPDLVKGIVAIEPAGPPFQNEVTDHQKARPWGITNIPITYAPPSATRKRYGSYSSARQTSLTRRAAGCSRSRHVRWSTCAIFP